MNCAECRNNLVACAEGLLADEELIETRAHLDICPDCRIEFAAITALQHRLITRGATAAGLSIVAPVMRRVRPVQTEREGDTIMNIIAKRWKALLTAAAGAAAVISIIIAGVAPTSTATAASILERGAKAVAQLRSIHLRGNLRTAPADNFSGIDPAREFVPVELWKQFEPSQKWRVEKPGRVAVMDGESTLLHIKSINYAMKLPQPSPSAFDTDWLHRMAALSDTIEGELKNAIAHGWKLGLTEERGPDNRNKSIVTVHATAGLPDSAYLKNKFFHTSDTRRVYQFDSESERLESVRVYVSTPAEEILVLEIDEIAYDAPLGADVFEVALPSNVTWHKDPERLPDNAKYAAMTPTQAARAFFEACARSDWDEAGKFLPIAPEPIKQTLAGLEIINLGEAFTSPGGYTGAFVPYEIKLKNGVVKKHNLALKKDPRIDRWQVDGGI